MNNLLLLIVTPQEEKAYHIITDHTLDYYQNPANAVGYIQRMGLNMNWEQDSWRFIEVESLGHINEHENIIAINEDCKILKKFQSVEQAQIWCQRHDYFQVIANGNILLWQNPFAI